MSLVVTQTLTAVAPGITSAFGVSGGVAPYTWSVLLGGAGGSVNPSTGASTVYTAPAAAPSNPALAFDTVSVTDSTSGTPLTASAQILVGDPLILFCDIIQTGMGLSNGRVYLWDQKIMQPNDSGLYVAVSVLSAKPYGNTNRHDFSGSNSNSNQSVNVAAQLQVDVISRGPAARLQKEGVLLAINSDYSEQQQNANGFWIAKLPPGANFVNLSEQDGAAIPYRFSIPVVVHYIYTQTQAVGYMQPSSAPTVNYAQS